MAQVQADEVVGIVVRLRCPRCKGAAYVPGGQTQYGELVRCAFCNGKGGADQCISLESVAELLRAHLHGDAK